MKKGRLYYVEYSIYYTTVYFILLEWLHPIMELTKTGYSEYFAVFIVICLVLALMQARFYITAPLKILYILYFIANAYSGYSLFSKDGVQFLWQDLQWNIGQLFASNFSAVSNPFRTLLFLLLIWMLVYLIQHWLTVRFSILYFLVLTIFFIATLDTFSDYDGTLAIIKVVTLGLFVVAALFIKRFAAKTGDELAVTQFIRYLLPVVVFISLATIFAMLMPKSEPRWEDPVPYLKGVTTQAGIGGQAVGKIGYGLNDEELGGGFAQDSTVAFLAHAPKKQYWRVEMKDYYTSKGWIVANNTGDGRAIPPNTLLPLSNPLGEEEEVATVYPKIDFPFILQTYGLKRVVPIDANVETFFNEQTEKLLTVQNNDYVALQQYDVIYSEPTYSFTALKDESVPDDIVDARFFQLPDTLPPRVSELAQQLTENYTTSYDKARAIVRYFQQSGFRYETKNIPYPADNQDYVDQFLFETKRGYCDNFSTSMVVMLRAVGIPARWVKGFAGGQQVGLNDEDIPIFEVQNNDAHSWVEAYIDGIGWMPFEPTLGFSSPASIDYDVEVPKTDDALEVEQQQQLEQQQKEEIKQQQQLEKEQERSEKVKRSKKWWPLMAILLAVAAVILYRTRRIWMASIQINKQKQQQPSKASFEHNYHLLLKQLERAQVKRQHNETLQNFARRVDEHFGTNDMTTLTTAYEQHIYRAGNVDVDYEKLQENWLFLMQQTKK